ncbi:tRNA pseudouridine(13) synthase TruD [Halioxenophilus sp. WMMB6]|uniref:tRNA pseudouridine(13) synthase TruD n=1 Tax=Halioxenophilus sp. WMMB6 TaxID=3073815 RepID=UPI00295E30F1|nr:tRNA pseudouridine(13) synthase TruD [Halioxenophilus sp. WMMB6]
MTLTNQATPEFSLEFAYAYGKPEVEAQLKATNADFKVVENLAIDFSGDGEHRYLWLEKDGENSHWVAKKIAEFAGIDVNSVGFSGMKDRNAITRQWFSVHLPKSDITDWSTFDCAGYRVLESHRHRQKLRRGQHQSNSFEILLRGEFPDADKNEIEQRLLSIQKSGAPNYFGEQRFGRQGSNLLAAENWLVHGKKIKNKREKGLVLSAARSYLFNQLLATRVKAGNWNQLITGDVELNGLATGALWGRGRLASQAEALAIEQALAAEWPEWTHQLEHQGLNQERRSLVLQPLALTWQWLPEGLMLQLQLAAGQFATTLLRELVCLVSKDH